MVCQTAEYQTGSDRAIDAFTPVGFLRGEAEPLFLLERSGKGAAHRVWQRKINYGDRSPRRLFFGNKAQAASAKALSGDCETLIVGV